MTPEEKNILEPYRLALRAELPQIIETIMVATIITEAKEEVVV